MPDDIVTKSGFIDFDSRNPLLEKDDGTVWRLEGEIAFDDIPMGADVEIGAVQAGPETLDVRSFRIIDE